MSKKLQLRVAGVVITLLAGILAALKPAKDNPSTKEAIGLARRMCAELEAEEYVFGPQDKEGL